MRTSHNGRGRLYYSRTDKKISTYGGRAIRFISSIVMLNGDVRSIHRRFARMPSFVALVAWRYCIFVALVKYAWCTFSLLCLSSTAVRQRRRAQCAMLRLRLQAAACIWCFHCCHIALAASLVLMFRVPCLMFRAAEQLLLFFAFVILEVHLVGDSIMSLNSTNLQLYKLMLEVTSYCNLALLKYWALESCLSDLRGNLEMLSNHCR